jgi:hypothetical protein
VIITSTPGTDFTNLHFGQKSFFGTIIYPELQIRFLPKRYRQEFAILKDTIIESNSIKNYKIHLYIAYTYICAYLSLIKCFP